MNICEDCAKQAHCSHKGVGCIGHEKINICTTCANHESNGGNCQSKLGALTCIKYHKKGDK